MKALEIVKIWNRRKSTYYRFVNGGEPSSLVKEVQNLIDTYGEDAVSEFFDNELDSDETDIYVSIKKAKRNIVVSKKEEKVEEVKDDMEMNVLGLLSKELVKAIGSNLANEINAKVEENISKYVQDKTLIKVVEYKDERKKVSGIVHEQFETILKFVAMDEPVMLVGPAGTGKNVIAKQVADALGLNFYFSNAVTQEYKLTGYGDANGNFVKTQFYDFCVNGGVFLLDEMDASCPEALVVLNCAIANRYFDFPVIGRVELNENCRFLANANTFGTGASMEYVGRNQLDGATLNRFALVEVNYDSRIEDNVCPNKELADFCRDYRKVALENGVQTIVSYRELGRLYKMIEIAKLDKKVAIKTCLTKGLESDTLRQIANSMMCNNEFTRALKQLF